MWNLLIRDVKIDAYTLMLNPTILITTFKLLLLILFTDICWVIEIKIKELAKNETPEYYEELKYGRFIFRQFFYFNFNDPADISKQN